MIHAGSGGHLEIVKWMLDLEKSRVLSKPNAMMSFITNIIGNSQTNKYEDFEIKSADYNATMGVAAWAGNIEIVELMLCYGASNYDEAMIEAAEGGHIEIVKLMIDLGADDYNEAMSSAAQEGHIEIVKSYSNFNRSASRYSEMLIY